MKLHQKGHERKILFRVLFSLFVLLPWAAHAQNPVEEQEWGSFSAAFRLISKNDEITIIAEDAPFLQVLTKQTGEKLKKDIQFAGVSERYKLVSNAYDYSHNIEGKTLVLKKNYTDIRDLPFVSFDEVCIALEQIERSLARLNPPGPQLSFPNSAFFQFLDTLTIEQVDILQTPRPMNTVTMQQQQLLQTVCAKEYMQTYATLSRINNWYLKQLVQPETMFRWIEVMPETSSILILDGPLGFRGGRVQKGLSHGFVFASGGPSDLVGARYSTPGRRPGFASGLFLHSWDAAQTKMWKDALTDLIDPTVPTPEVFPSPPPAERVTIGKVVERLNARAVDGETYQVDAAFAMKPVCVFGLEHSAPRSICQSLATLYGLELTQPQEKVFRIGPPRPPRVRNYDDVIKVMRRCFPEPYQRYYHAQLEERITFLRKPENMPDFAKKLTSRDAKNPLITHFLTSQTAAYLRYAIYDIAVQRLRAEIEPRLKIAENGLLKFSDAGVEAQRFFTLLCLVEVFRNFNPKSDALTTTPGITNTEFGTWFAQFDSLMLQVKTDKERTGAILTILDAQGKGVLFEKVLSGRPRPNPSPPASAP
jgi:hypothetical protein